MYVHYIDAGYAARIIITWSIEKIKLIQNIWLEIDRAHILAL